MLDPKTLAAVSKQVQRQFPEVAGCKPNVRLQQPPQAKNMPKAEGLPPSLYLVTYRGTVLSSEGINIPRLVRVVVNSDGKIIKITTSR